MTIATVDDIASGLASPQDANFLKTLTAPKAAGAFQSAWMAAGNPSAGVASPAYTAGAGYTCDNTTTGALPYVNGSIQNWLARLFMSCTQVGVIILIDRLWSCSGMGFAAATYTITTAGSLPARITDNGVDVEAWVEQFVAAGAASGTLTFNYLNAATGAAKAGVIPAVVSAPVAGQMQPIPMAAGDNGIRAPVSVVTSATWTSGSFGLTLGKRITEIPINVAGGGEVQDWAKLGLPKLPAGACIMALFLAANTTAPIILGSFDIIDK
jgi:hypothetical protein